MCSKAKFLDTATNNDVVCPLKFRLSLSLFPSSYRFSCLPFCFFFAEHCLIQVGKVCRIVSRIDGTKCQWVVERYFYWKFSVYFTFSVTVSTSGSVSTSPSFSVSKRVSPSIIPSASGEYPVVLATKLAVSVQAKCFFIHWLRHHENVFLTVVTVETLELL